MKIGPYNIYSVETGKFKLDGGAMFGIIPKALWTKTNPADEQNRVQLYARCLLLVSGSRKILIDTGMGSKWDDKSRAIYELEDKDNTLKDSLNKLGYEFSDITDVLLTHLHFDHTGGSVEIQNGKALPAFPNAKYYVQKKNFDWGMNPTERDRGSYIKENFLPLYEQGVFNFFNGDGRFDDNIEFMTVNGHTFGQQIVKISDGSQTLLYVGDLAPFSSHLRLSYIMGYDLQPLETLKEKKRILQKAHEEDWSIFFEHDPFTPCVKIEADNKGYFVKENVQLNGRS